MMLEQPAVSPTPPSNDTCCHPAVRPVLDEQTTQQVAVDLQLLAHPIRLQILALLGRHTAELCVCDIEAALPVKQPTVSHHLRLLREGGLIDGRKRGSYVYYTLRPGAVQALWQRVHAGMSGIGIVES